MSDPFAGTTRRRETFTPTRVRDIGKTAWSRSAGVAIHATIIRMTMPKCWWCGAPADSREHKFAAAELRLNYGPGPWGGENPILHIVENTDQHQEVRGPRADILKWKPSMCQACNNRRSQPFDRAYIRLLRYLDGHETEVGASGSFRFSDVYGDDWKGQRRFLVKYWLKHACCHATEIGLEVPAALTAYLDNVDAPSAPPHVSMALVLNEAMFTNRVEHGYGQGSGFGGAAGFTSDGEVVAFESYTYRGWLALRYRFDTLDDSGWTSFPDDEVQLAIVTPGGENAVRFS